MDDKKILLRKYLSGSSTPEEDRRLFELLAREQDEIVDTEPSYQVWQQLSQRYLTSPERSDRMYRRISEEIALEAPVRFPWKVAASVSILLLAAAAIIWNYTATDLVQLSTAYGERKVIVLPDGSQVTLNANTSLSYAEDWEDKEQREVWLQGEAYFEVAKKKNLQNEPVKFTVHADELDINVLGTAFNVNHRHKQVQVVLSEGKVTLQHSKQDEILEMQPGEMAEFKAREERIKKKRIKLSHYTAWKDGYYIFNNHSLRQVGYLIENNYGKKVVFADETLAEKRMTATIPATDLTDIISILEQAMQLKIEINDQQIIFNHAE